MLRRWKQLLERDSGFSLIELALVMLIVGILSATAGSLYLGYALDAKTVASILRAAGCGLRVARCALRVARCSGFAVGLARYP